MLIQHDELLCEVVSKQSVSTIQSEHKNNSYFCSSTAQFDLADKTGIIPATFERSYLIGFKDIKQTQNIAPISDLCQLRIVIDKCNLDIAVLVQTWVLCVTHQLNMVNISVKLFEKRPSDFKNRIG